MRRSLEEQETVKVLSCGITAPDSSSPAVSEGFSSASDCQGKLNERMLLPDYPLEHLRRLDVPAQMKKMVMNGAKLPLFNTDELPEENEPVRIYLEGRFWGIAARQGNQMAWKALIAPECQSEEMK